MSQVAKITACVIFFIVVFLLPRSVAAQVNTRAMTIIPPKFELFSNPGDQIVETIRVRNDSDTPATYEVVIEDFTSVGEEGQVVLQEEEVSTFSLARWIEPEATDLILQPGEERAFTFTINIPRNAEPGGHYASVLFQAPGEDQPGAAAVTQRIGALVLLRVSGNVIENAEIETFEAPTYSPTTPVILTLRVKNNGNTHINPKGTIIITDLFGNKVDELPLNGQNVLPGVVRKMDTEWKQPNVLGYYTATMVATYGQQNLPITAASKFFVINTTAAILIGVGTIAFILFVVSLISGRSRLIRALQVIVRGK
jgi:hypothetical protein